MESGSILAVRPNVTRDEAFRAFTAPGPASFYWRLRSGSLQRIADAYIPYYLYRAEYRLNGADYTHFFAIDAVDGSLDLFEFVAPPDSTQTISVSTRNHPQPALPLDRAGQLLRDKVLRILFQRGFFKVNRLQLQLEPLPGHIHLPYWLGLYGTSDNLRCRVLDAVRRRIEGARASALFEHWLAA